MKLYELTDKYRAILERVRLADSEEEFAEVADLLGAVEDRLEEKLDNCCKILRELELEGEMLKEEERRLASKRLTLENRAKRLKEYVGFCLGKGNSAKTGLFTLFWKRTTAAEIVDEKAIPEQYQKVKTTRELDIRAIGNALKIPGIEIPGARLEERLHLQIK